MSLIKPTVENKTIGTLYVVASAVSFSFAGILIKILPFSSLTLNGMRALFGLFTLLIYMKLIGHKIKCTKSVFIGAVCCTLMSVSFISSTQMTTAANAIILQFVHPVFVILLSLIFFKVKPNKSAVITCVFVFIGIVFFFFDKITPGNMIGNLLGIFSGLFYAVMFIVKKMDGGDFESSLMFSYIMCFLIGLPVYGNETAWSPKTILLLVLMGAVQNVFSYIFLSRGLDAVSPVTASLTSGIEPVLNPILVAVFYGEMIGPMSLIGSVIVFISIMAYSLIQIKGTDSQKAKTQ